MSVWRAYFLVLFALPTAAFCKPSELCVRIKNVKDIVHATAARVQVMATHPGEVEAMCSDLSEKTAKRAPFLVKEWKNTEPSCYRIFSVDHHSKEYIDEFWSVYMEVVHCTEFFERAAKEARTQKDLPWFKLALGESAWILLDQHGVSFWRQIFDTRSKEARNLFSVIGALAQYHETLSRVCDRFSNKTPPTISEFRSLGIISEEQVAVDPVHTDEKISKWINHTISMRAEKKIAGETFSINDFGKRCLQYSILVDPKNRTYKDVDDDLSIQGSRQDYRDITIPCPQLREELTTALNEKISQSGLFDQSVIAKIVDGLLPMEHYLDMELTQAESDLGCR